jgi:hypothetical protein
LAADRDRRPRDAQALAERVTAYRSGVQERLRRAELERAAAQAKAQEARKRQRLTVLLSVTGLLLLAVGGLVAWLVYQQQAAASTVNNGPSRPSWRNWSGGAACWREAA